MLVRMVPILALTLLFIGLLACQGRWNGLRRAADPIPAAARKDAYTNRDYTQLLAASSFIIGPLDEQGRTANGQQAGDFARLLLEAQQAGAFRKFVAQSPSLREQRVLAVVQLPAGQSFDSLRTYQQVAGYFRKHGQLPRHAADCLEYLDDPVRARAFAQMPEGQRLACIAPLIDPLSGRLYASFDNPEEPFGFSFEFSPLEQHSDPAGKRINPASAAAAAASGGCGCPAQPAAGKAAPAAGSLREADAQEIMTPHGAWPVAWQCRVVRKGETAERVLEITEFIF